MAQRLYWGLRRLLRLPCEFLTSHTGFEGIRGWKPRAEQAYSTSVWYIHTLTDQRAGGRTCVNTSTKVCEIWAKTDDTHIHTHTQMSVFQMTPCHYSEFFCHLWSAAENTKSQENRNQDRGKEHSNFCYENPLKLNCENLDKYLHKCGEWVTVVQWQFLQKHFKIQPEQLWHILNILTIWIIDCQWQLEQGAIIKIHH